MPTTLPDMTPEIERQVWRAEERVRMVDTFLGRMEEFMKGRPAQMWWTYKIMGPEMIVYSNSFRDPYVIGKSEPDSIICPRNIDGILVAMTNNGALLTFTRPDGPVRCYNSVGVDDPFDASASYYKIWNHVYRDCDFNLCRIRPGITWEAFSEKASAHGFVAVEDFSDPVMLYGMNSAVHENKASICLVPKVVLL
jgi:hypothetical protein